MTRDVASFGRILMVAVLLTLAACASGEVFDPTPAATVEPTPIPVLIAAPPPQVFGEACSLEARNLEFWLQASTFQMQVFRDEFNNALLAPVDFRTRAAFSLAAQRDEVYRTSTPECAVAAQSMLTGAMERGVEALQASLVDPNYALTTVANEVNAMFDQVLELQKTLAEDLQAMAEAAN
ncbi:MAG: hypothetical protein SF123_20140 [Chloroflexota bacterium]|nr:hypothetical protein [Chloroflexota bacterium]